MASYKILSDSACDLPADLLQKYHIDLVPFYITLNNGDYLKENVELSHESFFSELSKSDTTIKTSLPAINDYVTAFEKHLKEGNNILCFCISSTLSGSYQSAVNAAEILKEDYPNNDIIIIDSMLATILQGFLVVQAAQMLDEGLNISEIHEKLLRLRSETQVAFTLDSLDHLQRGGRIGKASALIGTLLNIKPILTLTDGIITPLEKVRGRKKALNRISSIIADYIGNNQEEYLISPIGFESVQTSHEAWDNFVKNTGVTDLLCYTSLGATVGAHVGPTALGIACMKKYKYL